MFSKSVCFFWFFGFQLVQDKCIKDSGECLWSTEYYEICSTDPRYWPVEEIQQQCLTLLSRWCSTLKFMRGLFYRRKTSNITTPNEMDMVNYYEFGLNLRSTCEAIERNMSKTCMFIVGLYYLCLYFL